VYFVAVLFSYGRLSFMRLAEQIASKNSPNCVRVMLNPNSLTHSSGEAHLKISKSRRKTTFCPEFLALCLLPFLANKTMDINPGTIVMSTGQSHCDCISGSFFIGLYRAPATGPRSRGSSTGNRLSIIKWHLNLPSPNPTLTMP